MIINVLDMNEKQLAEVRRDFLLPIARNPDLPGYALKTLGEDTKSLVKALLEWKFYLNEKDEFMASLSEKQVCIELNCIYTTLNNMCGFGFISEDFRDRETNTISRLNPTNDYL